MIGNGIWTDAEIDVSFFEGSTIHDATLKIYLWGETVAAAVARAVRLVPPSWKIKDTRGEVSQYQKDCDARAAEIAAHDALTKGAS